MAVPLGLVLLGCHDYAPTGPPEAVFLADGNDQLGTPGETLTKPLVVRVLDAWSNRSARVTVVWDVGAGEGVLCRPAPADCSAGSQPVVTDERGEARIWFRPTGPGSWTVLATADGLRHSPVTFSVWDSALDALNGRRPPDLVIGFGHFMDCAPGDPLTFRDPSGASDVRTTVGAVVEWVFWDPYPCAARVVSTSAPDGAHFDSGDLYGGERFRFVPLVAGTWEFVEQISGGTGTLTVR